MYTFYYIKPNPKDEYSLEIYKNLLKQTSNACEKNPFMYGLCRIQGYLYFVLGIEKKYEDIVINVFKSHFSQIGIEKTSEYKSSKINYYELGFKHAKQSLLPFKTIENLEIDPINLLIEFFQNIKDKNSFISLEIWIRQYKKTIYEKINFKTEKLTIHSKGRKVHTDLQKKLNSNLYKASVSIVSNDYNLLKDDNIRIFFDNFALKNGNYFIKSNIQKHNIERIQPGLILSSDEINSIIHFPKDYSDTRKLITQEVHFLPVPKDVSDVAKDPNSTLIGYSSNGFQEDKIAITRMDRNQHLYIVGKTGSGKTKLLELLMKSDIEKGEGLIFLDPHGDTARNLLRLIPENRVEDVIYADFADNDFIISFNPIEKSHEFSEVLIDGFIESFKRYFSVDWNPRLEFLLRQVIIALQYSDKCTVSEIPNLLTNPKYRTDLIEKIGDDGVKSFWSVEYTKFSESYMNQAVSPLLNKVGQLLTNTTVRRILSMNTSSFDVDDILINKKILIVNLSVGELGEWSSSFLGSMMISKIIQIMFARAKLEESKRPQANLYVDEFQNFSTESFIKIFSEARKYKLALTVAHQYLSQIDSNIMKSILGNVGSIISFRLGQTDAAILGSEFKPYVKSEDFVHLNTRNFWAKISVNGKTSKPFSGITNDLIYPENDYSRRIKQNSISKFSRLATEIDKMIEGQITFESVEDTNTFPSPLV